MSFHSGFVCILGRPNAGKSTLLNALAGQKLAIVSPKPQTTRNRVQGVIHLEETETRPGGQIILIDTPGVHKPNSALGRKMMAEVQEALAGCDLILYLVDASRKPGAGEQFVLDIIQRSGTPAVLLLNKIDLLKHEKHKLLPLIEDFRNRHQFKEIIPISALKRDGLHRLADCLIAALPEGPRYFKGDEVTDQPVRFLAAEIIREKVLALTEEEIPHAVTVMIEQFEETPGLTRIHATIYCERDGQKAILLGKGGQMMKRIGTAARLDIEQMLDTRVFLELFVKVRPGWRDSRPFVEELDWRRQLERMIRWKNPQ
jgi:GTP-binding protein Era